MTGERKDEYQAFMAHIPEKDWKDVMQIVDRKFKDRRYLVVGEKTPYEHMHFCIHMSSVEYRNFANQVFKQKYKLRGRATKNERRQYGKIKQIRDLEKLLTYMLKDGIEYFKNVWTTMNRKMLEELYETKSFEKEEKPYLKFMKYLKNTNDLGRIKSFGQRDMKVIELKDLANLWLKLTKARLPNSRSLWYYVWKSKKISDEEYIKITYNNIELDSYAPLLNWS